MPSSHSVQLAVLHMDDVWSYYTVEPDLGWSVDPVSRQIIVKKHPRGSRDIIPLDNVRHYSVEIKDDAAKG